MPGGLAEERAPCLEVQVTSTRASPCRHSPPGQPWPLPSYWGQDRCGGDPASHPSGHLGLAVGPAWARKTAPWLRVSVASVSSPLCAHFQVWNVAWLTGLR